MAASAGTAYVKIEPDFSAFNAKLHAQLKPITEHVKIDDRNLKGFSASVDREMSAAANSTVRHSKVISDAHGRIGKSFRGLRSLVTSNVAGLVGAGGILLLGEQSVKAAGNVEVAQARIHKAVTNAGISWKVHGDQIDNWVKKTSVAKGFMETDLSSAFANMIRSTGNVRQAQVLLNDAMDISRTKGMDLSSAQSLLARVYNGSYMGLKRLGIAITPVTAAQDALREKTSTATEAQKKQIRALEAVKHPTVAQTAELNKLKDTTTKATDEQKKQAKAQDALATRTEALRLVQQKFGGQAAAYSKTSAGHYASLKASIEQVEATIGKALLPTLDSLAQKGVKAAQNFQKHWPQIKKDIHDTVQPLKDVVGDVANFAKNNPDIAKAAISFGLIAGAVAKIKNSAAGGAVGGMLRLLTGSGGGGLSSLLSTVRPIPVVVTNPGFGGIPGSVGGVAGEAGAATGLAAAGSALGIVGGIAGIATIAGMVAESLLHKDIKLPAGSSPTDVKKKLDSQGAGFAASQINDQLTRKGAFGTQAQGTQAFTKGANELDKLLTRQQRVYAEMRKQGLPIPKVTGADQRKWDDAVKKTVGGAWEKIDATMKGHKFWTVATLEKSSDLGQYFGKRVPMQVKQGLAASMVAGARELEKEGRLPKGAAAKVAKDIEDRYHVLIPGLGDISKKSQQAIAAAFKRKDAINAAEKQRKDLAATYADFPAITKTTGKNMTTNYLKEMEFLEHKAHDKNKAVADQAKTDLAEVAKSAQNNSHSAATSFIANMEILRSKGSDKSTKTKEAVLSSFEELRKKSGPKWDAIKTAAITAIQDLSKGVVPTIGSTSSSLYNAFLAMGVNADQLAKALGITPAKLHLSPPPAAQGGKGPPILPPPHKAQGGLVQIGRPGAAGFDNIPLSVGNQHVVVGDGEQVAVLNRHQQGFLNRVLSPIGGMAGMFNKISRPHYATSGWMSVKASAELPGGTGYRGNPISPFGYSELSIPPGSSAATWGSALGRLPYLTHMRIRDHGKEVVAAKQDIGSGSSFNPAIGIYPGTAAQLGFASGDTVQIERADGVPLTVGGAVASAVGGAVQHILRQIIAGPDSILKRSAQKMADKGRNQINTWLDKHAPLSMTVGTVGPTSGPRGTSVFKGVLMADWVKAALEYAQTKGVQSQPTSGYRPGFDPHTASGKSEHQGIQYPHGAVDFGGFNTGLAAKMAVVNATSTFKWPLLAPIGFHDDGHASGTGHALGGFINAAKGWFPWQRQRQWGGQGSKKPWWQQLRQIIDPLGDLKKHKSPKSATARLARFLSRITNLGFPDLTPDANKVIRDGSLVDAASGLIDTDKITEALMADKSWQTLTKPDAQGNMPPLTQQQKDIQARIIKDNLPRVQLKDALDWLGIELGDQATYRGKLIGLTNRIKKAYDRREKILKDAQKRAKWLQREIKKLTTRITTLTAKLHPKGKHAHHPTKEERKTWTKQLHDAHGQVASFTAELTALTGTDTGVIPTTQTAISSLVESLGADPKEKFTVRQLWDNFGPSAGGALGELYQLEGPVPPNQAFQKLGTHAPDRLLREGPSMWLGNIGSVLNQLQGFNSSYLQLPPTPDTPGVDQYALDLGHLEHERSAVQALQQLVLQGAGGSRYPFGGSFAEGGQVPGPPGAPRMIVAHGNEWVVPDDQMGGGLVNETHYHGDSKKLLDLIGLVVEQKTRAQSRPAIRGLPGRGGR